MPGQERNLVFIDFSMHMAVGREGEAEGVAKPYRTCVFLKGDVIGNHG